ncbi:MAG: hypothetical protein JNK10_07390 [Cyclobacteriaceae bacterium]|nr:hypothetical protein [Cyclobacteriaceae bacterium]
MLVYKVNQFTIRRIAMTILGITVAVASLRLVMPGITWDIPKICVDQTHITQYIHEQITRIIAR